METIYSNFFTFAFVFSSPVTLLCGCEAFRWDSAKLLSPLGSPVGKLLQYEGSGQDRLIRDSSQSSHRTKRHRELVRTQPHLVHHMAAPEMREESSQSHSRTKTSAPVHRDMAGTRLEKNLKVEDEMEVKMRLY